MEMFEYIKTNDFQFVIDCRSNTKYPCQSGSGCCDGDYCRCGIITAYVPENINNAHLIARSLVKNQNNLTNFGFYCLERFISCALKENPKCFDVNIVEGYYGQEVGGIIINAELKGDINKFIALLNNKSNDSCFLVEHILNKEYGYVLPDIKDKNWVYESVLLKNIRPGNTEYKSLNKVYVKQYLENNHLSCLCKKEIGSKYFTLVDGYHRFMAAKQRGDKKIMVMYCEV